MENILLKMRLWFEDDKGQVVFGPGRALLLKKVQECGSLNKAAKALNMSYRAAWGKIKTSEDVLGYKLLAQKSGAKSFVLTERGLKLLEDYESFQQEIYLLAKEKAKDLF
ncbi:MAG: LysR family transcriptional regulator [Desulfonauticus sp.]|nr:LysR family transcriptional regulator [Desulfonauticus sp.]